MELPLFLSSLSMKTTPSVGLEALLLKDCDTPGKNCDTFIRIVCQFQLLDDYAMAFGPNKRANSECAKRNATNAKLCLSLHLPMQQQDGRFA